MYNTHNPCQKLIMPDALLYATIGNKILTSGIGEQIIVV